MARHNMAFLLGIVMTKPIIHIDDDTGEASYASCPIHVVRGYRDVGDQKKIKHDNPLIMTREPFVIKEMDTWEENDIVEIKGVIACKTINKTTTCKHCGKKNAFPGALVFINPIFARKRGHANSSDEAIQYLNDNREVSNQIFVFGRLCREPKKITPREGLIVTQYQMALNRKYRVRTDPPEIRTDFPWVKSYGENALKDRKYLHTGSIVFVDGCLQARSVMRKSKCVHCGEMYIWKDHAMEIVPYDTEYVGQYYSEEEAAEREAKQREEKAKAALMGLKRTPTASDDDDILTEDDINSGFTTDA